MLLFKPGDEDKFEIITITHPERWHPRKFQTEVYKASTKSKSSNTQQPKMLESPATSHEPSSEAIDPKDTDDFLNSMTYEEMTGQHSFNCEYAGYPSSFND